MFPVFGPVAQLAEQWAFNPKVVGSWPTRFTKHKGDSLAWDDEAKRAYAKNYYAENGAKMRKVTAEAQALRRQLAQEYVIDYLSKHPCIDCGEDDIIVLEFDHVDRATKEFNVSKAVRDGTKLPRLIEEINKCVVRCANCHRRKTYAEMGYTSRLYPHQKRQMQV